MFKEQARGKALGKRRTRLESWEDSQRGRVSQEQGTVTGDEGAAAEWSEGRGPKGRPGHAAAFAGADGSGSETEETQARRPAWWARRAAASQQGAGMARASACVRPTAWPALGAECPVGRRSRFSPRPTLLVLNPCLLPTEETP